MKMFASELTPKGNFFVGGTFESRVWSGEKFVDVQNVAVYQPRKNAWLPLQKDTVSEDWNVFWSATLFSVCVFCVQPECIEGRIKDPRNTPPRRGECGSTA